jgi:hypothetical protein
MISSLFDEDPLPASTPLAPEPPYLWPEPRVLAGLRHYATAVPFDSLLRKTDGLFGIVSDIDDEACNWWENLLCEWEFPAKIILALYPACTTRQSQLERLYEVQRRSTKVEFHLVLADTSKFSSFNLLCWRAGEPKQDYVAVGTTPIPPSRFPFYGQTNLVIKADQSLVDSCLNWFEYAWANGTPLTSETAKIPPLVPATGSSDAAVREPSVLFRAMLAIGTGKAALRLPLSMLP